MKTETDFVHDVASVASSAYLNVEIALSIFKKKGGLESDDIGYLENAMRALEKIKTQIDSRRRDIDTNKRQELLNQSELPVTSTTPHSDS